MNPRLGIKMNKLIILICTIVTFGFASNAFARQYFVSSTGNDVVAATYDQSPYVIAYSWSSGFGSKYSNPATASASNYDIAYAG